MRVALIFNKTRQDTTGVYFERACQALGIPFDHWWVRNVSTIPLIYDLYLRIDHGDDYEVLLPSRCRPAVFYALDTHLPHSWRKIHKLARTFDLVFCCHREAARRLRGAKWLPVGCDFELHGPIGGPPVLDIAFVGTDGGIPRKFYLQALRERYPNNFIGAAPHTQLSSIYSRAKIGFNYSIANDVNMRIFEVLAAGALLVTSALTGDDLSQLGLEDRRHLALYRSPEELFSLIDYYVTHDAQRQATAQAGAQIVCQQHTYAHRLRTILQVVQDRLGVKVSAAAKAPS